MGNNKKSVSPKKSKKCHKSDSSKNAISFEFVYYNDFWFNQKEYNKIENRLYLGTDIPIKERETMEVLEVRHIISVTEEPVPHNYRFPDINYIHVEAGDFPDQDLLSHFDFCNKIIETALKNGMYFNCIIDHGKLKLQDKFVKIIFILNDTYNF